MPDGYGPPAPIQRASFQRRADDLAASPESAEARAAIVSRLSDWGEEYELLDSGGGAKLERFGPYVLARPEKTALWRRGLADTHWREVDAIFDATAGGEGSWRLNRTIPERWLMHYRHLSFWLRLTPFRHTGVFPEQASHWDWVQDRVRAATAPVNVLNLFAYTGLSTLAAAAAGASVTHVDASRPTLAWARDNAVASGLADRPIRWILDDALKFARREARRGRRYEGILMDPPVFGRGPKGELWRFSQSFPDLLQACRQLLADPPLFVVITAYATEDSSLTLRNLLADMMEGHAGELTAGELVLVDRARERPLSLATFARWSRGE